MNKQKGFALGELIVVMLWLLAIGGWIANVVKLVVMLGEDSVTTMFIARCVGVAIAPLGVVLGFL